MSTYDRLFQKGYEEGYQIGVRLSRLDTVKNFLTLEFKIDDIVRYTGFSEEEVYSLITEMVNMTPNFLTLEDFSSIRSLGD